MTENAKTGLKILLIGGTGSGKTYCPALLAEHGISVHYVFTENGMATFSSFPDNLRKLLGKKIHYTYIPAVKTDLSVLLNAAKQVNSLSYENLTKMLPTDRNKTIEFQTILQSLMNYKCEVSGKEFGSIMNWGPDRCIVLDSLSGLNLAIMRNLLGTKPVAAQHDWQVAMRLEEELINMICLGLRCWAIVTAHPERELDEVSGAQFVYAGALGRKLGPKIGRFFDEVIQTVRRGDKYLWSNAAEGIDTKRRILPLSTSIPVDWTPLVEAARGE
jgi:hypothetical protein